MTPERAKRMIQNGETLDVEFQGEERAPLSDADLVETVVCLANRSGEDPGWIFLGVEDDGRITGARPRHPGNRTDPLRVQALVAHSTRPKITPRVRLMLIDQQPVVVIEVSPSKTPITTAEGKHLRRVVGADGRPVCLPYDVPEIESPPEDDSDDDSDDHNDDNSDDAVPTSQDAGPYDGVPED